MDGGVQQAGPPRRFRQRGGVKKKKKRQQHNARGSSDGAPVDAGPVAAPVLLDGGGRAAPAKRSFNPIGSTQLDAELARYLYQLSDDLQRMERDEQPGEGYAGAPGDADESESPMLLLARNGLQSLRANLHEVAAEPMGSRILETLIRVARVDPPAVADTLSALLARGSRRVAALAEHRCGSHVLQSLVDAVASSCSHSVGPKPGVTFAAMGALAKLLQEWTVQDVASVMSSASGSHVFRAIVAGLAGIPAEEPKEQKLCDTSGSARLSTYIEQGRVQVPDEWGAAVCSLAERLLEHDEGGLHGFLWSPTSSAAFQCLLAAVSVHNRDVAERLVTAAVQGYPFYDVCVDASGARFMERVVVCLGAGYVLPSVKGRLAEMARDSKANYVLQRIILGLKGRGAVMSAWDELEPSLSEFMGFSSTRLGVALAMVRAAEVEGDEQTRRRAARAVAKSVDAVGTKARYLVGILFMGSMDRWERWRSSVKTWCDKGMGISDTPAEFDNSSILSLSGGLGSLSLLGVLISRSLMRYPGGPGQVCRDSMANLTHGEVIALSCHAMGSRLVEQWVISDAEFGNAKVASSVVSHVLDSDVLGALCRSPYGAQVLSRSIPRASVPVRKHAMEALAARAKHLREHDIGRQVLRKCRVDDYLRRKDEWQATESARDTRHRLFGDILAADEPTEEVGGQNDENEDAKDKLFVIDRRASKKSKRSRGEKVTVDVESLGGDDDEEPGSVKAASDVKDAECGEGPSLDSVLSAIVKAANGQKSKRRRKKA